MLEKYRDALLIRISQQYDYHINYLFLATPYLS